jgi:HlyD family secretion protein
MSVRTILIGGIVAVAVAAGVYASGIFGEYDGIGLGLPAKTERSVAVATAAKVSSAPVVSVVTVEPAEFVETLALTGTLVPREEILIATEVEGLRIVDVAADESQLVKKGDVLARLETASLDAQLAQNDAALAKADAAIAQAESAIASAQAKVVEAANALARAKPLRQSGYLAEATFDQRESAARSADASLVSTRDGLTLARADKAQTEALRRDLVWKRGKTEIKAPADGLISRRTAKIGAMAAGAGDPMFRLIANSEVELDAEVPEVQLSRIEVGQAATLTIAGLPDLAGRIRLVSPEIDRTSRLGRVRILALDMAHPRVGSFARASVVVGKGRGLGIPAAAVQFQADGATVQLVQHDHVVTRKIVTGLQSKGFVEVKSGLAAGDSVVARAGTFVRDGDIVRPVKSAPKLSEVN